MQCRLILQQKRKTGRGLRWVAETIVGLVYPPRCPICDRVTVPECVRAEGARMLYGLPRNRCVCDAASR